LQPRSLELSLNFLNPGITYTATVYTDDANVNTATHIAVAHKELRRGDKLQLSLSANGGEAVVLQPSK
jgi:alpha-glucosidase